MRICVRARIRRATESGANTIDTLVVLEFVVNDFARPLNALDILRGGVDGIAL